MPLNTEIEAMPSGEQLIEFVITVMQIGGNTVYQQPGMGRDAIAGKAANGNIRVDNALIIARQINPRRLVEQFQRIVDMLISQFFLA